MEDFALGSSAAKPNGFVDPWPLHSPGPDDSTIRSPSYLPPPFPISPALSGMPRFPRSMKAGSQSPNLSSQQHNYPYPPPRRRSLVSYLPYSDQASGDEQSSNERCTYPDCGKVFKDLRAHMLTHQTQRPEKCPIQTCGYHKKGFARKYDRVRHVLTHFKGKMVCGFCPGTGSSVEKVFNRADVFKRHLTYVHAVEQTPPNSRKKKTSDNSNNGKKLSAMLRASTSISTTAS